MNVRTTLTALFLVLALSSCSGMKHGSASTTATAPVTASTSLDRAMTMKVQKALNKSGAHVKVDGKMGKNTEVALKSYQEKNGLKATGATDSATLNKLGVH